MDEEVKKKNVVNGGGDRDVCDGGDRGISDGGDGRRAPTVARRTTGPTRRSTKGHWTPEEDAVLTDAVKRFNGKNWKRIAGLFKERTDVQCLHRWQKVLNPELIKGAWTKEEDDLIIKLVEMHGCKNWSGVARSLPGRIGKQCRERWVNHLNPAIKKGAWTKEEETILIHAHRTYGNKWAEISKLLPGRSDNSIKNHWNCSLKKRIHQEKPEIAHEISSIELQNIKSLGQKLYPDDHSTTPNTSSIVEDTIMEKDICSPSSNGIGETIFPVLRSPLQVENATDSKISCKNFSGPDDYNKMYSPICYSPPPTELSLSFGGYTPNSVVSVLRRAARSFEAPSIIKRRWNQSNHHGVARRSDIWSTDQFCHLSRDYLRLGTSGSAQSVGKRLEPEFDMEREEETSQQ